MSSTTLILAWSPDNRRAVFSSNRAGSRNVWEITLSSGALKQITTGPGVHGGPAISRNGKLAYTQGSQQQDLYLRELATGTERRLTHHTRRNYFPRLSPSGNMVAYQSNRTGNFDIWVLDLTTGEEKQLARHPAEDQGPDWSPDGSQVVFVSNRDGEPKIWLAAVTGGRARKLSDRVVAVESARRVGRAPRWSPDGKLIGYVARSKEGWALWAVNLETADAEPVLSGVADFAWYKDSRRVVYTPLEADETGSRLLKVINLKTKQARVLFDEPLTELAASPDGAGITFLGGPSMQQNSLWLLRLEDSGDRDGLPKAIGAPERLTEGRDVWHAHNGGWSADGKSIVYTRETAQRDIYVLENYR